MLVNAAHVRTQGIGRIRSRTILPILLPCLFPCGYAQQAVTNITPTAGAGDLGTIITQRGNNFDITRGERPNDGPNLFHSFGQFSLGAGDIANFANNTGLATQNILSRVTGGSASDIFGTIQTTGFPEADLYLLNPAGVLFGPGASVNVAGSFFVSTADFLEFGNGARFNADRSPVGPQLAVVPPEAFGFLSNNPAAINVQNDSPAGSPFSFFSANPEETLALIGGPVVIGGGILARSGSVNIVSSGSGGTARLEDGNVALDHSTLGGPLRSKIAKYSLQGHPAVERAMFASLGGVYS